MEFSSQVSPDSQFVDWQQKQSFQGLKLLKHSDIWRLDQACSSWSGYYNKSSLNVQSVTMKLPQEIVDYILDFLHDDIDTLRFCALASREFLQTSRYHRFNGLKLSYSRISQFDALLRLSPDIAKAIRSLSLLIMTGFRWSELGFLTHLPALADLTIGVAALRAIASHVPNLITLRVYGTKMLVSSSELVCGISMFPSLQELELIEVDCLLSHLPLKYPSAPPLLRVGFQGGTCVPVICGWLAAVGCTPPFHSFSQTIRERNDAKAFVESAETLSLLTQELTVKFIPEGNMNGTFCYLRMPDYEHH